MQKTPTPWTLIGNNTLISIMKGGFRICSFKRLAHSWDEQRANADFVLKAVNCHDDLIAIVEEVLNSDMAMREEDEGNTSSTLERIRSFLQAYNGGDYVR